VIALVRIQQALCQRAGWLLSLPIATHNSSDETRLLLLRETCQQALSESLELIAVRMKLSHDCGVAQGWLIRRWFSEAATE